MTIMIGIDPHKATYTAVAIDSDERVLDEFTVRASKAQTSRFRAWASRFDEPAWAVESARGLGYLLSQQLVAAGETVFDVPPVLASRVRFSLRSRPLPSTRPHPLGRGLNQLSLYETRGASPR